MLPGLPIGSLPSGGAFASSPMVAGAAERIWFLSTREINRATLAASTSVSGLPVTNLQNRQPQKKWRSTSVLDQYINATLYRPLACNAAAFNAHDFSAAGVWRALGATDAANLPASPDVVTPWQSVWPSGGVPTDEDWPNWLAVLRWTNDAAIQNWRIELADPAASFIGGGRLALGRAVQPSRNIDLNLGLGFEPSDQVTRTPYGFTYPDERGDAPRRFTLPFSSVSESDLLSFISDLQRLSGLAGDLICCIDPAKTTDHHAFSMHGLFAAGGAYEALPLWDAVAQVWRTTISLTELL